MRLWFCAPSMKSRLTCHRAVSPKITPYRGLLICCLLRYLVALHSALSLNSGIVTLIGVYTHPIDLSCHQKFENNSLTGSGNIGAQSWKI